MLIYNTLSKRKEEFVPIDPPNVTFYMCGPTVYDFFHIGNGRSFIVSDIIRRYLIYKGYNVKFAMNLTDIDDKIIQKSIKANVDSNVITSEFTNAFFEDITKLGIKKADIYPKATEHIQDIINLVQSLVDRGMAYDANGDVYYDVGKFTGYGKLSGKKIEDLESGARIEINENKKNPLDFTLWKKAKEGEPAWDSPWGKGRPGWHIECSAMSMKHLGESIDIHAGGNDLIFPHHENEIAQSEGAHDKQFVKYWLHFGFLNIKDEKMSKSLGNFFTAREILSRHNAEAIRLLFAQTHYRGPLSYSEELIEGATKGVEKLSNFYRTLVERIEAHKEGITPQTDIDGYRKKFENAMDDDFNTPQAVAVLFDLMRDVNKDLSLTEGVDYKYLSEVKELIDKTGIDILGVIKLDSEDNSGGLQDELIQLLIDLRLSAKNEKNYAFADQIRDGLEKLGVILRDSKEGTTFRIN